MPRARRALVRETTFMPRAWGAGTRKAAGVARARAVTARRPAPLALAGGELKFHDLDIDDASIAANGTIIEDSCITIAQGLTEANRIGRKLTIRSIGWRFNISNVESTGTDAGNPETIRLILYQDKQTNKAAATITGILESDSYQSFNNLANKGRFLTLMDRTYTLNPQAGGGDGTTSDWAAQDVNDSFFKSCNIPVEYDNSATTGEISSVTSNNLGVLILSKTGGASIFDSKMRLRFTDA